MSVLSETYTQLFVEKIEMNDECKKLATILLKTENCCKDFYIGFLGRNRHVIDDLLDYREEKLKNYNVTIEDFLLMCYNGNMQEAIEVTFLQSVDLLELAMIDKAIAEGRASLEVIYNDFQKNPNKNILKNVL